MLFFADNGLGLDLNETGPVFGQFFLILERREVDSFEGRLQENEGWEQTGDRQQDETDD